MILSNTAAELQAIACIYDQKKGSETARFYSLFFQNVIQQQLLKPYFCNN